MFAALLLTFAAVRADDFHGSVAEQARRTTTHGAVALGVGSAAVVGGLGVMLVGRGEPGGISEETAFVHESRTIGGVVLVVGGLTSVLVGSGKLSKGAALRERATGPTAWLSPLPLRRGAGIVLDARF